MAIRNATGKNAAANGYKAAGPYGSLHSADPGTAGAATNELSGGSPAYARKAWTWGSPSAGTMTSAATPFDVASGSSVAYVGVTASVTATTADLIDSTAVTTQAFASQGTYTVTATLAVA